MTEHAITYPFRKHCLATAIGLLLANPSYALQALSDDSLSNTTGEGVALVLDDFKMVFQQPNDLSTGSSYTRGLENPSQYDTGFIRIIPTGENYQNISEHTYKKVYNQVYDAEYLAGVSTTSTLYQSTYTTTFNNYKTQNYSSTKTAVSSEISVGVRQSLVAEYFESDRMKQYYQQRYNEYYNEGRINATKDGTTIPSAANPTLRNKDASTKYALQNTYEMIEILYGNRNTDTVPSTQWTQGVTRFNHIDPKVAQTVETVTQERLNLEGDKVAKAAATNAIKELELLAVDNATQAAKTAAAQTSVGSLRTKADVFIYGLALSKSDNSLSSRYSNQGFNWGSADNPWLFRAGTEKVKQFKNVEKDVGYLALEAPLATTTATESDNNIKLGFWTDIFSRQLNSSAEVDPSTGAPKSGLDKEHRLRTQFVANGLSLNGSQTRVFQTLDSDNPNHHQTLGMASLLRLNTNDNPANLSFTDSNLDSKGIRISTAAKSDTLDGTAVTPAIDGSLAPVFHDTEGLYLYSPNINLVLGNMYQPFVVGSEGNNIVLEVTRIPNVPEIYNKIYQNYEDGKGGYLGSTAFTGSTCNVVSCGTPLKANANDSAAMYQGRNATHSSIAIGTVERLPNNMLRAKDHDNATGVVFKGVDGSTKNLGSVAIDGVLIQHLKFKTTGL
ncbi:hypothetical protein [Acinetobacter towneri]|uniref:hypothetical protein n=1 Tax=Acinetobacter towneri TaxID=202956 RepID=UPI00143693F2|nr:hypothetical protein [Acinetobacter towneri]MCA4815491.1 hypothetical protein [Acinetobacter towneri]QIV92892.1 hypothetical protein GVU25_08885 [Acinetobacter towneri]